MRFTLDEIINYISLGSFCEYIRHRTCRRLRLSAKAYFQEYKEFTYVYELQIAIRPSISPHQEKFSKTQMFEIKQIASLGIHIQQCIREFKILKSHSCTNNKLVSVLYDVVYYYI